MPAPRRRRAFVTLPEHRAPGTRSTRCGVDELAVLRLEQDGTVTFHQTDSPTFAAVDGP